MKKSLISATAIALALSAGAAFAADLPSRKDAAGLRPAAAPAAAVDRLLCRSERWRSLRRRLQRHCLRVRLGSRRRWPRSAACIRFPRSLGGDGVVNLPAPTAGSSAAARSATTFNGATASWSVSRRISKASPLRTATPAAAATLRPASVPAAIQIVTPLRRQKSLDYLGTVRGRIGYSVTPTLLALWHGRSRLWRRQL